jgi:predicted TIM-barrel fold metal-dependent hydrolase
MFDTHIHIRDNAINRPALEQKLADAGMEGGVLLSLRPASFVDDPFWYSFEERLDHVLRYCEGNPNLYPFFWVDPTERSAVKQVEEAARRGVAGFKIICNHFYPGDPRAMPVYHAMACHNKPLLFHSGILWDGAPSAAFNHPGGFESLLPVSGLRFMLAHVSWPWCDECIAVYGKFQNAYSSGGVNNSEMFIDLTPGTPPVFRRDVITKLFTVGYDIEDNLVFGTDCNTGDYNVAWTKEWVERDTALMNELGVSAATQEKVFSGNLMRFLGITKADKELKRLVPGE